MSVAESNRGDLLSVQWQWPRSHERGQVQWLVLSVPCRTQPSRENIVWHNEQEYRPLPWDVQLRASYGSDSLASSRFSWIYINLWI